MKPIRFYVMSDLHTSGKTGRIARALELCKDGQFVLLAGDLVNDGKESQFVKLKKIIEEKLTDMPVFSVSGNHDYPILPVPSIRNECCDYSAFQDWLHQRAQSMGISVIRDASGAYAVDYGDVAVIGLNCTSHWRRFVFKDGAELEWLEKYLKDSQARWHVIMCHAPLAAHHANGRPDILRTYLSRDSKLQRILDRHSNIIFASGHTHISPYVPEGQPDVDHERHNLYLNCGSVCTAALKGHEAEFPREYADGNVMEILIEGERVEVVTHLIHNRHWGEQV